MSRPASHGPGRFGAAVLAACAGLLMNVPATACTDLLVTRGATDDGFTSITYTCDGEFHPHLRYIPAAEYEAGDSLEISDWGDKVLGKVAQPARSYAVVQLMNEHQVAIGESTFDGREELRNPDGLLHYWTLMRLALQRSETAREAVEVMGELVADYGYSSSGESFSISDPEEVWYMEMIGPGPGGEGANWVARRVPDGYISAHANMSRIAEFPLRSKHCLYSPSVIDFAVERGYYDPDSGEPFRFNAAYDPLTPLKLRYCAARVWSLFRRAAPSLELSSDFHRGLPGAEPYPLWIKPDEKLGLRDIFALMRDHYEDTDFDLGRGLAAGPYGLPYRWRPLSWEVDGEQGSWERAVSTQQTGFSIVSQSRKNLPDPVGGLLWYGVDDTWFTCYTPLYCCITELPESFTVGSLQEFSWDSAWWVFNFVSNYAGLRYDPMERDIRAVQSAWEGDLIDAQPAIEAIAVAAQERGDKMGLSLASEYLSDYCVERGEALVTRWRKLGEELVCKYNDGYVKDDEGSPRNAGYPDDWLRTLRDDAPARYKVEKWPPDTPDAPDKPDEERAY